MHPKLLESTGAQCRAYMEAGDCHGEAPPVERLIAAVALLADQLAVEHAKFKPDWANYEQGRRDGRDESVNAACGVHGLIPCEEARCICGRGDMRRIADLLEDGEGPDIEDLLDGGSRLPFLNAEDRAHLAVIVRWARLPTAGVVEAGHQTKSPAPSDES